jgi:hypothetical protein
VIQSSQIREHMEVVSSDNHHVGKVDHVLGEEIELAKLDLQAMGRHHKIPMTWVERVDDKVHLNLTRDSAKEHWMEMQ